MSGRFMELVYSVCACVCACVCVPAAVWLFSGRVRARWIVGGGVCLPAALVERRGGRKGREWGEIMMCLFD